MSDELNANPSENPAPPPVQAAPPPQQQPMYPPQGYYQPQPQNDAMQSLIPTQNPPSLVSYYCGVFSLIPCFAFILGPIAIIFGIIAFNKIKAQPGLKGKGHAITGIILGSLTTLGNIAGVVFLFMSSKTG